MKLEGCLLLVALRQDRLESNDNLVGTFSCCMGGFKLQPTLMLFVGQTTSVQLFTIYPNCQFFTYYPTDISFKNSILLPQRLKKKPTGLKVITVCLSYTAMIIKSKWHQEFLVETSITHLWWYDGLTILCYLSSLRLIW